MLLKKYGYSQKNRKIINENPQINDLVLWFENKLDRQEKAIKRLGIEKKELYNVIRKLTGKEQK